TTPMPGLEVTVDGAKVEALPGEVEVKGGVHQISAKASGYRPLSTDVNVEAGAAATVSVDLKKQGVYLDIKPSTPEAKLKVDTLVTPLAPIYVPIGKTVAVELNQK